MDEDSIKALDSVVENASLSLFEDIGVPLGRAPAAARSGDDIGASIGFTSPTLRGALVLVSTRRLVRAALPIEVREGATEEHVSDWMGELTNQLLGRIKNKLFLCGVTLAMSTPTVIVGLELASKDSRSTLRRQFAFRHGEEPLTVYFDAMASEGLVISAVGGPPGAGIAEGELALF